MRVPDISSTAGYAARITQLSNNEIIPNFSQTLTEANIHNNKNGNFGGHVNRSLYLDTAYASAADEFVQRALNSTQVQATTSYAVQEPTRKSSAISEGVPQNYCYVNSEENVASGAEDYGDNTYRSFKEVFNINKAIFKECDKDFENINTLENANAYISDTDIDPIVLINSQLRDEQDEESRDTHPNFISAAAKQSLMQVTAIKTEKDIKEYTIDEDQLKQSVSLNDESEAENDCDDHSMIDLCNDSTKSTDDNDLDEYLTSPSSSSISLRTPRHSYFPRGIINPNYPGFQHLAHTLSEHFIGSLPSDSYDSDMSEYEMELSADSFDELPLEQQQQQREAQFRKSNLFNNNNDGSYNNSKAMNLLSFYGGDETTHPERDIEHNTQPNNVTVLEAVTRDGNLNANDELDIHTLKDNLETVLTFFEASTTTAPVATTNSAMPLISTGKHAKAETKMALTVVDVDAAQHKRSSNTPDILIKNHSLHVEPLLKKENRPDLLRGVSPRPNRSVTFGNNDCVDGRHATVERPLGFPRTSDANKDEISFGMTPVDIIGDFEQEVEREFGLLVSGYRRLMDGGMDVGEDNMMFVPSTPTEKLSDAALSGAKDQIDSDKFLNALHQRKEEEGQMCDDDDDQLATTEQPTTSTATTSELFIEDSNAVDWSYSSAEQPSTEINPQQADFCITDQTQTTNNTSNNAQKPKYQKSSYDERQLPPVVIDYKRCQPSNRVARKSQSSHEKHAKAPNLKVSRNHSKPSFTNRFFNTKRGSNGMKGVENNSSNKKLEEAEFYQYQQLISDKELILSNSRYAKMSSWAQYLKNSVKERNSELISPSALELFDAYKIGGTDLDLESLRKHMKMAKEIEKKRRSEREEIRRRLAMGAEENSNDVDARTIWKPSLQSRIQNGIHFSHMNDASSDTESHSSDSETCPKLSKTRQQNQTDFFGVTRADNTIHPYNGRPLSVSCSNNNKSPQGGTLSQQQKHQQQQQQQQSPQQLLSLTDNEDKECDFFTKQARLQIEARMALAQAKEMAHMQMEVRNGAIERQHQRVSPITEIIRGSLEKVGVQMTTDKRRVSRQMLTDMNIAQLQILVNSLHTHIEGLNESLVHILMERDDLHVGQDSMLVDIEELSRYIGAKENLAKQQENKALTLGTN